MFRTLTYVFSMKYPIGALDKQHLVAGKAPAGTTSVQRLGIQNPMEIHINTRAAWAVYREFGNILLVPLASFGCLLGPREPVWGVWACLGLEVRSLRV